MSEERTELASNADWILFRESDGSVTADFRKDEKKPEISVTAEFLREMQSLMGLIEGGGVTVE